MSVITRDHSRSLTLIARYEVSLSEAKSLEKNVRVSMSSENLWLWVSVLKLMSVSACEFQEFISMSVMTVMT